MPPASMITKQCSGHASYPPTPIEAGAGTVFINDLKAARTGDAVTMHASPSPNKPHARKLGEGSSNIMIEDEKAIRIGDPVVGVTEPCEGHVMEGSDNVIFN